MAPAVRGDARAPADVEPSSQPPVVIGPHLLSHGARQVREVPFNWADADRLQVDVDNNTAHGQAGCGVELMLVNARHVKNLPGRKTAVSDAAWLAQLAECGLLRGSFVPPAVIAQLRDLTRYRKKRVEDRAKETQRVQKVLQDAGIKLDSVVTDVLGKASRRMPSSPVNATPSCLPLLRSARP